MVGLVFSTSFLMQGNSIIRKHTVKKSINWGNAIKAAILSSTSLYAAYFYYKSIIAPYVIHLAQQKGLAYAIEFNKDFVLKNPDLAILYAVPLFLAAFHALLVRDYAKKIWHK